MARKRISRNITVVFMMTATSLRVAALSVLSHPGEAFGLFAREGNTCANSSYTACNQGLPGNFCCPSGDSCYVFNQNQSAICCPQGKDCSSISTISCDITQQNITLHPISPLFTTQLDGKMPTCGDSCCPVGMSCNGNQCRVDSTPSASSSTPSSTGSNAISSPTTTSPTSTMPSASSAPSSTTIPSSSAQSGATVASASAHCKQFPAAAVLVGFFSGLTVGIILAVLLICCFGRHGSRSSSASYGRGKDRPHSDFSSVTANVSDPIYQPGNERADFLRRDSASKYKNLSDRASRVRSFFARTPTLSRRNKMNTPTPERTMTNRTTHSTGTTSTTTRINTSSTPTPKTPKTPKTPSTLKKEPSMESIKIYSPPNIAGLSLHPMPPPPPSISTMTPDMQGRGNLQGPPQLREGPKVGAGGDGEGEGGRLTTFREMMAEAGLREGRPYLGSPGRVDPRSRRIGEV